VTLIVREREGEAIDRGLIKAITEMLIHLGVDGNDVYQEDFEKPFLELTTEFYALESQHFLLENDASVYLKKVERRLKEEEQRVDHYLDASSKEKIQRIVEKELIYNQLRRVLEMENTGLVPMLADSRIEGSVTSSPFITVQQLTPVFPCAPDLLRMYKLYGRVSDGLDEMRRAISLFVVQSGQKINDDPSASGDAILWVQQVIELKAKFDHILEKAFEKDKNFQTTINDVCSLFS